MSQVNYFGWLDYIVVGATLGFSMAIGIYHAFASKQTSEDVLVGGRKMSSWPIAASMLVTYLSAISVLGYPSEIFSFGIQLFITFPISMLFFALSAFIFVPFFYEMKLTSIYEYLEIRFESSLVRKLASAIFIVQVLTWSGLVLYTPSIVLEAFVGLPLWISILGIGLCGTIYTSIGGFKSVVWSDVLQFGIILIGMLAIVIRGFYSAGGFTKAFETAHEYGRLKLFDLTVDPFMRLNLLNMILGTGFSSFIQPGTHQLQVQRYCSLPTSKEAVRSLLYKIPLSLFVLVLSILTGISIFSVYASCDPILLGEIKKSDQILPYFVINELSEIPGMIGLFTALIFSAVLSTISSSMNSLAAVTWQDFLSPMQYFQQMSAKAQSYVTRGLSFAFGILFMVIAFFAKYLGPILPATITAFGATSGPLGGIFLLALFIPVANKHGGLWGMLIGITTMVYIAIESFILQKSHNPLPTDINGCPAYKNISIHFIPAVNYTSEVQLDFPERIFTLSFLLYPFMGSLITIVTGLIISLLTGGFTKAHKDKVNKYLHTWLQKPAVDDFENGNTNNNIALKKFSKIT